jgi:hypothetical protein
MLSPAQVIPFLTHDEPEVRDLARRYLVSAHDPAPATADDFWAAADKGSPEDAGPYLDRLGFVPQTETSLRRLLDELPKADPATRDSLRRTLERVEFDLLKSQWETIRASDAVSEPLRQHLQARLDLANEPAEPLWDRLMAFARGLGNRDLTEAEELEIDRLIEGVSRHPDVFRERVIAALKDADVKDWAELCAVDIAGEMKLGEAIGLLLDKLKVENGDFLWQVAADAVVQIGDERVVEQIAERFARDGSGFQISAAEILGRIKRPESQRAVVQLITSQQDLGIVGSLAAGLVELLPDDAETFATLRALARDVAYDRSIVHLDEELLTLSTMTGVELPEGPEWRQRITRDRSRWAMGMSNVEAGFQSPGSLGPSTLYAAPPGPRLLDRQTGGRAAIAAKARRRPRSNRLPFKNAKAKVGRNDPCPCGSGKKYKKCCGR